MLEAASVQRPMAVKKAVDSRLKRCRIRLPLAAMQQVKWLKLNEILAKDFKINA